MALHLSWDLSPPEACTVRSATPSGSIVLPSPVLKLSQRNKYILSIKCRRVHSYTHLYLSSLYLWRFSRDKFYEVLPFLSIFCLHAGRAWERGYIWYWWCKQVECTTLARVVRRSVLCAMCWGMWWPLATVLCFSWSAAVTNTYACFCMFHCRTVFIRGW